MYIPQEGVSSRVSEGQGAAKLSVQRGVQQGRRDRDDVDDPGGDIPAMQRAGPDEIHAIHARFCAKHATVCKPKPHCCLVTASVVVLTPDTGASHGAGRQHDYDNNDSSPHIDGWMGPLAQAGGT